MELQEILPRLVAYFPPEDHKERVVKGGGKWYYVPHQAIRERLNEVCPGEWQTEYSDPYIIDGEPVYHCKLTICGVTRTGIGDKSNEPSPYGTAAQRAFRKAFTDAAEQFGIAAYLDEQTSEKTRNDFVKYMHQRGNTRVAVIAQDNDRILAGEPTQPKRTDPPSKPFGQSRSSSAPISDAQRKRLWAIASNQGKYTEAGFKRLIEDCGFESSKSITRTAYEAICQRASDIEAAKLYNQEPQEQAS